LLWKTHVTCWQREVYSLSKGVLLLAVILLVLKLPKFQRLWQHVIDLRISVLVCFVGECTAHDEGEFTVSSACYKQTFAILETYEKKTGLQLVTNA